MNAPVQPNVAPPSAFQALAEARTEIVALYRQTFEIADRLGQMTVIARRQAGLLCHLAELHAAGRHEEVAAALGQLSESLHAHMPQAPIH